jgi:GNAT superfamily N-acetyltransferase
LGHDSFEVRLPVAIRRCRETDLPMLEWFGAFAHHRAIIREAFELQEKGEAVMLVAVTRGFPVGQAWLDLRARPGAEGPMVWAVRVIEPLQGLGVGRRLMAMLERSAAALGHSRLELGVEKANGAARAFYEREGWRVARERREAYSYVTPEGQEVTHGLDEWVMVKRLDQAGGSSPTRS